MNTNGIEDAMRTILQSIEELVAVAEHRRDRHARNGLLAQAASLNNLGERVKLHQLPDGVVRSAINDVRLDTLMILTDLKVSLTFQKQELAAPSEKLRVEAHERLVNLDDHGEAPTEATQRARSQQLSVIVVDLRVLGDVEKSLRNCVP